MAAHRAANQKLSITNSRTAGSDSPPGNGTIAYSLLHAGKVNLIFRFVHTLGIETGSNWIAQLHVKAADIPRLMREGFYWDNSNVVYTENRPRISDTHLLSAADVQEGWVGCRMYSIKDKSSDIPQWVAELRVYARDPNALFTFHVSDVALENIYEVVANNVDEIQVYGYCQRMPQLNFNAVYCDRAMEGWWPWPRKTNGRGTNGR